MVVRLVAGGCFRPLGGRVVMATVVVAICFCGIVVAEQPVPASDSMLQQAKDIVEREVLDGDLRGAWFQIDGKDGAYAVIPLLDVSRVEEQVEATRGLLTKLKAQIPAATFTLRDPVLRPISELVETLQHEMEASMDFPGVSITGAVFTIQEKTGDVNLSLQGRVSTDKQRELIQAFSMETMYKHSFWGGLQPGSSTKREFERAFVDCAQLKKLRPSPLFGSRLFSRGMELFRDGDVDAARKHFRASMVESSGTVTRHYWLILCELELGKIDRARNLLREPLNRIRDGQLSYDAVLRSLERVQGQLRWKLIALEDAVLMGAK